MLMIMMMMTMIMMMMIIIISTIWQHVPTSKGHLQDNNMKYIEGIFCFLCYIPWD